jgi:hypothetical protein
MRIADQLCALVGEEVEQWRQIGKEQPPPGTRPMKEAVLASIRAKKSRLDARRRQASSFVKTSASV